MGSEYSSNREAIDHLLVTPDAKLAYADKLSLMSRWETARESMQERHTIEPFKDHGDSIHFETSLPITQLRIIGDDGLGRIFMFEFAESKNVYVMFRILNPHDHGIAQENLRRWLLKPLWRETHHIRVTAVKEEKDVGDGIYFVRKVKLIANPIAGTTLP